MDNDRTIIKNKCYTELDNILKIENATNIFVVMKNSRRDFNYISSINSRYNVTVFSDFEPNPDYESVVNGVRLFRKNSYSVIIAIGGGSAIDVAKCIKFYAYSNPDKDLLIQNPNKNDVKLVAIPTTAGTGSEETTFAVIYKNGEKLSIDNKCLLPSYVILDSSTLKTLPVFQKKATSLDTFCHCVESFWSVNSTDESRSYSKKALKMFLDNYKAYLENDLCANDKMIIASNLAGKAINISKTTAPHAMSYKITKAKGYPHGKAVAICLPYVFEYMNNNISKCQDKRGPEFVQSVFNEIADVFEVDNVLLCIEKIKSIIKELDLGEIKATLEEIDEFSLSVNEQRLKNSPIRINEEDIKEIYYKVFEIIA